jgi:hypothetical protein
VECAPIFINNTITGNTANWDGGGFYCYDGVEPVIINTILWGNSPQEIFFGSEPAQSHTFILDYTVDPIVVTISYSDVEGGLTDIETNGLGTVNWGEGNIDRDPLFFDAGCPKPSQAYQSISIP